MNITQSNAQAAALDVALVGLAAIQNAHDFLLMKVADPLLVRQDRRRVIDVVEVLRQQRVILEARNHTASGAIKDTAQTALDLLEELYGCPQTFASSSPIRSGLQAAVGCTTGGVEAVRHLLPIARIQLPDVEGATGPVEPSGPIASAYLEGFVDGETRYQVEPPELTGFKAIAYLEGYRAGLRAPTRRSAKVGAARVTFRSGQYVTVDEANPFDAVAVAITHGRCALRSVDVLMVEMAGNRDGLMEFRDHVAAVKTRLKENAAAGLVLCAA
jgi:hypothetical protein